MSTLHLYYYDPCTCSCFDIWNYCVMVNAAYRLQSIVHAKSLDIPVSTRLINLFVCLNLIYCYRHCCLYYCKISLKNKIDPPRTKTRSDEVTAHRKKSTLRRPIRHTTRRVEIEIIYRYFRYIGASLHLSSAVVLRHNWLISCPSLIAPCFQL